MTAQKLDYPGQNQPENGTLPEHVRQQKPLADAPSEHRTARKSIVWLVLLSLAVVFGLLLVLALYQPSETQPDYSSSSLPHDAAPFAAGPSGRA